MNKYKYEIFNNRECIRICNNLDFRTCVIRSNILIIGIDDVDIRDFEIEIVYYIISNIGKYINHKYGDKPTRIVSYYFEITNTQLLLELL